MKITQSQIRKVIQEEIAKVNETARRRPNALDLALKKRGLDYGRWATPAAWNDPESGKTDYKNKPFVMSSEDPKNYERVLGQVEAGEMTAAAGADKLIRIVLDRSAAATNEATLNEDIDPDDFYVISGENIIELRKIANELSMKEPNTAKFIQTLVSEPNNVRAFEVDKDGKFGYTK